MPNLKSLIAEEPAYPLGKPIRPPVPAEPDPIKEFEKKVGMPKHQMTYVLFADGVTDDTEALLAWCRDEPVFLARGGRVNASLIRYEQIACRTDIVKLLEIAAMGSKKVKTIDSCILNTCPLEVSK